MSQPDTVIATAADPDSYITEAATLLQTHLRRAYGRSDGYEIVVETTLSDVPSSVVIAVGATKWSIDVDLSATGPYTTHVSLAGYVLRVLCRESKGTPRAAALLLEMWGIRLWGPGTKWASRPASTPLYIANGYSSVETPDTEYHLQSGHYVANAGWRRALGAERDEVLVYAVDHNLTNSALGGLGDADLVGVPKIQPAPAGTRLTTFGGTSGRQPCMHHTSTLAPILAAKLEAVLAVQDAAGVELRVWIAIADGGGYCLCSDNLDGAGDCVTDLAAAGGSAQICYTAQWCALLNAVATIVAVTYPTAEIWAMAYHNVGGVPPVDLDSHIRMVHHNYRPGMPEEPIELANDATDLVLGLSASAAPWETYVGSRWGGLDDVRWYGTPRAAWQALDGVRARVSGGFGMWSWSHDREVLVFSDLTPTFSVHGQLMAQEAGGFHVWHAEAHPAIGVSLAEARIIAELAWDLTYDIAAGWTQWAADLFPMTSASMLAFAQATSRLFVGAQADGRSFAMFPFSVSDRQNMLTLSAAQQTERAAASAAITAAQAASVENEEAARIATIAVTWWFTDSLYALKAGTGTEAEARAAYVAVRADVESHYRRGGTDVAWLDAVLEEWITAATT